MRLICIHTGDDSDTTRAAWAQFTEQVLMKARTNVVGFHSRDLPGIAKFLGRKQMRGNQGCEAQ